jgi:hypothetical protein
MIKEFLALTVVLVFITLSILLHMDSFDKESVVRASQTIAALSHSAKLSTARSTIESSAPYGLRAHNVAYPELPKIDYLDFVYAQ